MANPPKIRDLSAPAQPSAPSIQHPLAGKKLHFAVEVTEVRDASLEELAHGHVHGEGGHHH